jgi:hypothetical protein
MKSTLLYLTVFLLFLSSCGNYKNDSTDLKLVSENLEVMVTSNHEKVMSYLGEIKSFQLCHPDLLKAWNDKLNNTTAKIELMGVKEKKTQDFLDQQIAKLNDDSKPDLDKINSSLSEFLSSIVSNVERDDETSVALDEIKSILIGSKYNLDGTIMENTLALKSVKLNVAHAYARASNLVKSKVSLSDPEELGIPRN